MVSAQTLGVYLVAAGILIAVPGPNHLYLLTRSLTQGRAAGLASMVGIESATLVHIGLAAAGFASLIAVVPGALTAMRYAGGGYLTYLAIRTWRAAEPGPVAAGTGGGPTSVDLWAVAREGFVVNLLNPKVVLFFVAFIPQFLDPDAGRIGPQVVVLGLLLLALGVSSNLVYVLGAPALRDLLRRRVASSPRPGRSAPRPWGRRVCAAVYLLLGVTAVVGGVGG